MARSSRCLVGLALTLALGGCDVVLGVDREAEPCDLGAFDPERGADLGPAEDFSLDWDETFGVVANEGFTYEIDPRTMERTPTDLGPYASVALALAPEGDSLFYTALIEPPVLKGALRADPAAWKLDAGVPAGTFAGTPSADVFGPRRVLVKLRESFDAPVQEYEDQDGRWVAVGDPLRVPAMRAPHLTPNGLTLVYASVDESPAIVVAQRSSTSAPFGAPTPILAGTFANAQLLGNCKRLYATDRSTLRRYDR